VVWRREHRSLEKENLDKKDRMRKQRRHAFVLIDLINENGFERFVEIGVARSFTLTRILQNTELSEYWAVDPWVSYDFVIGDRWESWYLKACRRMLHFPQLRILRMDSALAASMFPDGYFDMVYIDADHRYEFVLLDIKSWLPKVRKGGILGGHDYGCHGTPGVKKAVDECFMEVEQFDHYVWIKRV
jgi:predicted O-methyltransferase YrrM